MKYLMLVCLTLFAVGGMCAMDDTPMGGDNGGDGPGGDNGDDPGPDGPGSVESDWPQEGRLTAFDAVGSDLYGDAVATVGDTTAVGSETMDSLAGVVDVFLRFAGEWRYLDRLTRGPSRFPEQSFGSALAMNNQYVFVGAQKYAIPSSFDIQHGAVYVFRATGPGYEQIQLLTIDDGQDYEYFGNALAFEFNQGRLIAGAFGRNTSQGAAYVFRLQGQDFAYEDRLEASDGNSFANFGSAVAMSNVYAAVGAPNKDSGLGAVYVFERVVDQWNEIQKISAPDGVSTDKFGQAVAMEGNTLVISAPSKMRPQDVLLSAGYVYIYERSGANYTHQQTLIPEDANAGLFGASVAISDGIIAVGIEGKGRVVLYEKDGDTWSMTGLLQPDDTSLAFDSFGNAMTFFEDTLVVGARSATIGGVPGAGAAYVFTPDGSVGPDLGDGTRFRTAE